MWYFHEEMSVQYLVLKRLSRNFRRLQEMLLEAVLCHIHL